MKGLIIVGSAKAGSHTTALSQYLKGHFEEHDFDVEIFDLAEQPIHQLDVSGASNPSESYKNNLQTSLNTQQLIR